MKESRAGPGYSVAHPEPMIAGSAEHAADTMIRSPRLLVARWCQGVWSYMIVHTTDVYNGPNANLT